MLRCEAVVLFFIRWTVAACVQHAICVAELFCESDVAFIFELNFRRHPKMHYSRVSNDAVRRRANAPRLEATIRRRQLLFLGSTLRRAEDHPDRLACFQPGSDLRPRVPQRAKRRRGAPRKVWAETILPLCEQRWNKSRADIIQLAQNPREWNIAIDHFCRQIG